MSNYLKIDQDTITTDLEYEVLDNNLIVTLDHKDQLSVELNQPQATVELKVKERADVDVTMILSANNADSDIHVKYDLASSANVNSFVTSVDSEHAIKYTLNADLKENANIEISNGQFGDVSTNYDITIDLNGAQARALHNIAAIGRDTQKKQYDVTINNNALNTYGELNNFGVVKDSATLIFNGTGYIKNGAKGSKAHQASKIITFDPKVVAQANPFLIIDEADVEASHAAAVGQMDEDQLFYLQSRGLNSEDASRLITYGYLKPILEKISDESLKEQLEKLIEDKVGL